MRDETDQKELVLGNKQLLSIFFIVIAMLGVAFTLGYMIGRNTANVSAASMAPGVSQAPATVQSPAPQAPRMAESQPPAQVVQQDPTPPPVAAPVPQKVTGTSAAKPYDSESTSPPVAAAPAPVAAATSPSYLQVAAMKRADADHMVSVLRDRGFPALVGESPKEGLFRVLVGPYKDISALVDAKAKLKAAGFDNPLIAR
jgi:cell division septation protein DedD